MSDRNSDVENDRRKRALNRLAALQRLREHLREGTHEGSMRAIESMIEQEAKVLARGLEDKPA